MGIFEKDDVEFMTACERWAGESSETGICGGSAIAAIELYVERKEKCESGSVTVSIGSIFP